MRSKIIRYARRLLPLALACVSVPTMAASHCVKGEIDYFSCKIKGSEKSVSVCGTAFRDDKVEGINGDAWIQYRFGKPGELELTFPDKKYPFQENFTSEFIRADDVSLYALKFKRGQYDYEVMMAPGHTVSSSLAKARQPNCHATGLRKQRAGLVSTFSLNS